MYLSAKTNPDSKRRHDALVGRHKEAHRGSPQVSWQQLAVTSIMLSYFLCEAIQSVLDNYLVYSQQNHFYYRIEGTKDILLPSRLTTFTHTLVTLKIDQWSLLSGLKM